MTRTPFHAREYPSAALLALRLLSCSAVVWLPLQSTLAEAPAALDAAGVLPFVEQHCVDCHSQDYSEAGVVLDGYDRADRLLADRDTWTRALKQVRAGAMPPDGCEEVPKDARRAFVEQLTRVLEFVDTTKPIDPGRVTARRLNKEEYDYTIRDLFGVELRLSDTFPDDDSGYGFDNNGDVLTVSPLHLEQYLAAAEQLTAALFDNSGVELDEWVPFDQLQADGDADAHEQGGLIRPGAAVGAKIHFPAPGKYSVACGLWRSEQDKQARHSAVRLSCGDQELGVFLPEEKNHRRAVKRPAGVEVTLTAGVREVRVEYALPDFGEGEAISAADLKPAVVGPILVRRVGDAEPAAWPPLARLLRSQRPSDDRSAGEVIHSVAQALLERCWRRAVTPDEAKSYAGFALQRLEEGAEFEQALAAMTQAVLVSPEFLFRVDQLPPAKDAPEHSPISDAALASRLSYFLWCSAPDEELLALARRSELGDPAMLLKQVERLLDDPRSDRFIQAFFGQWLGLRKLEGLAVDTKVFRRVSSRLKEDMQTETLMLAESVLREDQSLLKLINADYTFVNKSLARLYGIEGVDRNTFQRVSLEGQPRRGLLTHASVLTLTSYPNRTSPPRRGAWVLENLLGDEPPDPPADVPELAETQANSPDLPLRKQLELHRSNATCASCHETMDAIGFGLENYNAIGQWRDKDKGQPIDAAGDLPGGQSFAGALELIDILSQRDEAFADCVTRKVLTFALGRGLEYYDRIAVEEIVRSIKQDDYRFSRLISEVVLSRPFRLHRVEQLNSPESARN